MEFHLVVGRVLRAERRSGQLLRTLVSSSASKYAERRNRHSCRESRP